MASNDRQNNPASLSEGYQSTEFDDSFNSVDLTSNKSVNSVEDSNNHEVDDSYNDNSVSAPTDIEVEIDKTFTDNSKEDSFNDNSKNVEVEDSFNEHKVEDSNNDNSVDTDLDVDIEDAFNDTTDNSTDNSTDIDVGIEDSFKDLSSDDDIKESFNDNSTTTDDDLDVDVGISGSFNPVDSGLVDVGDIGGYLYGIIGNDGDALYNPGQIALQGDGNIFDIDQALSLSDGDSLCGPSLSNNANFNQQAWDLQGGTANGSSDGAINPGEGDVTAGADAAANGMAQLEAFNQTITMGANIQYASVDMDVIGGSDGANLYGDDA